MITQSDEPMPTTDSTTIDPTSAADPTTPLRRSPVRNVNQLDVGATIEKTSGRAMISQPMCEVEYPRPFYKNCGSVKNPPM
jgi:hypothetical protein